MSLCAQHKIALKINKAKAVRRKQTEFYSRAKRLDFYHKLVLRTIKNLKSPRRLGRMATEAYTEFRYLLVRLARQLHHENCEDLIYVHKIAKSPDAANQGLYVLSRLEAEGHFDPYTPEKLQEILSKISRKDLAHDIKEYKHSSAYKKAVKLEQEREKEQKRKAKKKGGKDEGHGEASEEREEAARLLSHTAKSQEERQWMDMFAMALTHTAQLVEQMKLLRKAIQSRGNAEHTHRRVEDAVQSIETAQDEVETLSKTLKKAISAAGLKSRRASQEGLLDDDSPDEGTDTCHLPLQLSICTWFFRPRLEKEAAFPELATAEEGQGQHTRRLHWRSPQQDFTESHLLPLCCSHPWLHLHCHTSHQPHPCGHTFCAHPYPHHHTHHS